MTKNRFIGEAHAVVAMIFRPRPGALSANATSSSASSSPKFPLPSRLLPPNGMARSSPSSSMGGEEEVWCEPPIPLSECEVFFILRATNPQDRWSGQVALPGGRKKSEQESDRECAARETMEEVGLDISQLPLIGRTHDRVLLQRSKKLVVSCLVFFAPENDEPGLCLAKSEVAACGWCPVSFFAREKREICRPMQIPVKTGNGVVLALLSLFGIQNLIFTRYQLPVATTPTPAGCEEDNASKAHEFHLWGLTLGLVSEILLDHGIVKEPLNSLTSASKFNAIMPVEEIFDNPVHNVLYSAWKRAMPPMDFMGGIQAYVLALGVFAPAAVLTAAAGVYSKL